MAAKLMFVPTPGIGHLISTIELAKRILRGGQFSITVFMIHSDVSATQSYMDSVVASGLDIQFEELPHVDLPRHENQHLVAFLSCMIEAQKPHIKGAIMRDRSVPIAALFLDMFCTSMIDVADELGIPAYIYFTSSAAVLGAMLYLPTLHVKVPCEIMDVQGHIHHPGLPPVPPHCMPETLMDKKDEVYTIILGHSRRFREAKGLIVNTFSELEGNQLKALAEGKCLPDHPTPPVFSVGPLISTGNHRSEQHVCIEWLDRQPLGTVVFLCFGSLGSFSSVQLKEMAVGLEKNGHRFLWALRMVVTEANHDKVLPEGFLERTKERGMVWTSWAPQVEILAHPAVGGFVTHCGWNSVLESLWFGVPMLGWPLYAEQHLNCLHMVSNLSVAIELKLDYENGRFVSSDELEKGVRCLMGDSEHGKKARAKVEEMKLAARRATEEGGCSYVALQCMIGELIKNRAEMD